jgi:hypothetical protein
VTKYWKRRLTANVKGQSVKLDDLQAEFQIRQSDGQHPDWAYLRMLNLHDNTSNSIWGKGEFKIEAGYHQGPFGLIFSGEITQQRRGKLSGVDRYHDVMAISGAQAYSHAVVEKTFDKGTTQTEMAREAAKQMTREGVTVGHIGELFGNPLDRPWTVKEPARDFLRTIGRTTASTWQIFNGAVQMTRLADFIPGSLTLNDQTGLIGIPEQTLEGIVAKILIRSDIKVGQRVTISQQSIKQYMSSVGQWFDLKGSEGVMPGIAVDGVYKVVRIDHDGSVHGQEWYTTLTCLAPGKEGIAAGSSSNRIGVETPEVKNDGKSGGG